MSPATQAELFGPEPAHDADELRTFLNDGTSRPVRLFLTRNRVSMLSVDFAGQAVRVRAHEHFLHAPPDVLHALRTYVRTRRREAWLRVAGFAQRIPAPDRGRVPQRTGLRAAGRVYNLKSIRDEVNRAHFNGRVSCRIGWGRRVKRKRRARRRSILFGSWSDAEQVIRVHPLLDDEKVPTEFVRYIVFHEMLHAVVPEERDDRRRVDHTPTFRRLEAAYPGYDEMRSLAGELVHRLVDRD